MIKDLEELRILEEKRFKEIEREKSRKRRLESGKETPQERGRKKLKYRRCSYQLSSQNHVDRIDQTFVEYECDAHLGENASCRRWQPSSWEEFDALFRASRASEFRAIGAEDGKREVQDAGGQLMPKTPYQGILKRKRGRPRTRDLLPEQRKAKRIKLSTCSVNVTRLEIRKLKTGRKSLSPKKRSLAKKSPVKSPSKTSSVDDSELESLTGSPLGVSKAKDRRSIELFSSPDTEQMVLHSIYAEQEDPKDIEQKGTDSGSRLSNDQDDLSIIVFPSLESENECMELNNSTSIELSQIVKNDPNELSVKEERSSTRLRKTSHGRASELASMRKAMLDFN